MKQDLIQRIESIKKEFRVTDDKEILAAVGMLIQIQASLCDGSSEAFFRSTRPFAEAQYRKLTASRN